MDEVTAVLSRPAHSDDGVDHHPEVRRQPVARGERVAFAILLITTAALYLWNLSASGWANGFYSAAAQAGAGNWTAMLFGSSDAANAITVDKTPAALWVMDVSVRLFGLSSWSVLAPQALEGVAAVALLYAAVRRAAGPSAALLAGAVFALTPVAALMFRFNNPDALLVLALVAAAYCVQRACAPESSRWWLIAAGAAVGVGFLAKMLQAFLVLPALGLAYLIAGAVPLRKRLIGLFGAVVAMVVSGGWYLLLVELWPASSRPYIGGSQNNSIVELALGYNGLGRLTGEETGGLGNMNFDVGWGRMFGSSMGAFIAWLIPAAVVCLAAGLIISRRAPRTDPTRAGLVIWGGWLVVTAVVFSYANGILHQYYTVALAPAIGATIGIGAIVLWRNRFDFRAAVAMSTTVLVTVILAAILLARRLDWLPWLGTAVAVAGVGAAALLLVVSRLPARVGTGVAALAVVACLGRADRVHARHGGHATLRRHPVGRAVPEWRLVPSVPAVPGWLPRHPQDRARPDDAAGRGRPRPPVDRRGRRVDERGGLPAGRRRAGDGRRRVQRHRSRADARGVPARRRRRQHPLLHQGPLDVRDDVGTRRSRRQPRGRRHRRLGRGALRGHDGRRRRCLRPDQGAERFIAAA